MTPTELQALILRARANLAAKGILNDGTTEAADTLHTQSSSVQHVDANLLGINEDTSTEEATEIIGDVIQTLSDNPSDATTVQRHNDLIVLDATTSEPIQQTPVLGVQRNITLNERQEQFNIGVQSGKDIVLIGAAGTGKTTSMRRVSEQLIASGRIKPLSSGTKFLTTDNPGAAILSFTNKAVNNIRHAVVAELKQHTLTIHKLLEFAPIFYQIEDPAHAGSFKQTMRFEPSRNSSNPLPPDLTFLAFEESSMIAVGLYNLLQDAMPHPHQEVFLGDIQQLPPTFGLAILGFKMLELPVVELTEVYRQALDSPIISCAWKLLEGNPHCFNPAAEKYKLEHKGKLVDRIRIPALAALEHNSPEHGSLVFQPWQKKLSVDMGCIVAVKQFCAWADQGYYNTEEDMILCPYNVSFGTIEVNKGIAQHLGLKREAIVHEVIAGFNKHYLAVGDRVLFEKEDAFIIDIARNSEYLGKPPQPASIHLDRWGHYQEALSEQEQLQHKIEDEEMSLEAIEALMASVADSVTDRVQAASHVIIVKIASDPDGEPRVLDKASQINNLLGGYCITVHKAQGSEWEKVFILLHHTHAKMCSRELLYTAVTRARKHLHIICEPDTFYKGVSSQRIAGNTWQEKAEKFKGKLAEGEEDKIPRDHRQLELVAEIGVIGNVQIQHVPTTISAVQEQLLEKEKDENKDVAEGVQIHPTRITDTEITPEERVKQRLAALRAKLLNH